MLAICAACAAPRQADRIKLDPQTAGPCDLLSRQEASVILDKPLVAVQSGELHTPPGADYLMCVFAVTDDDGYAVITLRLYGRQDPARAVQLFQQERDETIGRDPRALIADLGDAFWDHMNLTIRRGDLVLRVSAKKGYYEDNLGMAKQAAQSALARLP